MSEVYVLVKQVSDERSEGRFTIHGVTETEAISDTWMAAGDNCYSLYFNTREVPDPDGFCVEEDTDEEN